MKLQNKITLTLLLVSLITTGTVGTVAYWNLMSDFRRDSKERAFANFRTDLSDYLARYGSLAEGQAYERFDQFVRRRHMPPSDGVPVPDRLRPGVAPFRFLMLDPDERVIDGAGKYSAGQRVPKSVLRQAHPIFVEGEVALQVVQIGDPILTVQDHKYLKVMKQALISGILYAGGITLLLGLFLGRRLSLALGVLIDAISTMNLDGELGQEIPVRSRDEIGQLATAFNTMNTKLTGAHAELRESHDQVQRQADELKVLSTRDPLTGLYNRRHFDEQAKVCFHQSLRRQQPLSVVMADLDHFKQINDTFSHAVGDAVLCQVAKLLEAGLRSSDVVARYGGEEFIVLLPDTDLGGAVTLCEKLRCAVASYPWHKLHEGLRVTLSIGISDELSLANVQKIIAAADACLYQAKRAGRNRVVPGADVDPFYAAGPLGC